MTDLLENIEPITPLLDLDTLERDWTEGNFYNEVDAVRNAQRNIPRLIAELRQLRAERARPSPNGKHGYEVACFGCGKKFTVARRPTPGKRSWCADCVAAGEPAAQRARDYRARKRS